MNTDLEKSLKSRIRQVAKEMHVDPAILWQNLVIERFLVRLAQSPYHTNFILKGGILLSKILPIDRETRDIDFTVHGIANDEKNILKIIQEVISIDLDDGFSFRDLKVHTLPHSHMRYPGVRVSMLGTFVNTKFKVFIDLACGDIVNPRVFTIPLLSTNKGALFESHVEVSAYPVEFIFAEKLETVVRRGSHNSRMKDFHDLFLLVTQD